MTITFLDTYHLTSDQNKYLKRNNITRKHSNNIDSSSSSSSNGASTGSNSIFNCSPQSSCRWRR